MKHTVKISVQAEGKKQQVLQTRRILVPKRLLRFFFGDFENMLILVPYDTVHGVVIEEERPKE